MTREEVFVGAYNAALTGLYSAHNGREWTSDDVAARTHCTGGAEHAVAEWEKRFGAAAKPARTRHCACGEVLNARGFCPMEDPQVVAAPASDPRTAGEGGTYRSLVAGHPDESGHSPLCNQHPNSTTWDHCKCVASVAVAGGETMTLCADANCTTCNPPKETK